MKIKELTIYGFGQWIDYRVSLSESLTLFYGKNEAGKSSLHKFILFVLFGMPPRERKRFMPKTSGRLGGRITVLDEQIGEYTIERIEGQHKTAAVCYLPGGGIEDEAWLKERLKGVELEIYESIYSFAATDLIGLEEMQAKELGDVILSIGLTGSKHIYELEKKLKSEREKLFKKYGKNPLLNQKLEQLNQLGDQVTIAKSQVSNYETNIEKIEELSKKIEGLKERLHRLKEEEDDLHTLKRSVPLIQEYKYVEAKLAQLPESLAFPEEGMGRLEELRERLIPLESEKQLVKEQLHHLKQFLEEKETNIEAEDILLEAEILLRDQGAYEERAQQVQRRKEQLQLELVQMEQALSSLNIGISLEDLLTLHVPYQFQDQLQALEREYESLKMEDKHLEEQYSSLVYRGKQIQNQIADLKGQCLSQEDRAKIFEQLDQLAQSPTAQHQLKAVRQQMQREKRQQRLYLFSSALMTIILLLLSFWRGDILFTGLSFLPLFFGIGLLIYSKNMAKSFRRELAEIDQSSLGLQQQRYYELQKQIEGDRQLIDEIKLLEKKLKEAKVEGLQMEEKRRSLSKRQERLKQQVENIGEQYPFLKQVALWEWGRLFNELSQLKKAYNQWLMREKENQALRQLQETYRLRLGEFCQKHLGQEPAQAVADQVFILKAWLDKQVELKQQWLHRKEQFEQYLLRKQEIEAALQVIRGEMADLFAIAKVQDEEAYYEQHALLEEKKELQSSLERLKQQISLLLKREDWQEELKYPLDDFLLDGEIEDRRKQIQAAEELLESSYERLTQIQAENLQIEESGKYSSIVHEFKRLENEFNRLARRWAVLQTSEEILQQAIVSYQGKYLKDVLEKTSSYFQTMTQGAYSQVLLGEGEGELLVLSSSGQYFNLSHLSKGTLDQLYISLRLAISQIVGRNYKLPFIIDDAFLHSDEERTEKILKILEGLAKEQQVILFTCRKHIADSLPGQQQIRLERKKIV